MSLGSGDLERLADEAYHNRRISTAVFCGRCGYNLRTLPYIYNCPECGQAYNARPLKMTGVFVASHPDFPTLDSLAVAVFGFFTYKFFSLGWSPRNSSWLSTALVFAAFTIVYIIRWSILFGRFVRYRRVVRRIEDEETEWVSPHR